MNPLKLSTVNQAHKNGINLYGFFTKQDKNNIPDCRSFKKSTFNENDTDPQAGTKLQGYLE